MHREELYVVNSILKYGVATPFIRFNFYAGSIESDPKNPRYFMSFEHNRTCKCACTFKLTIVYVPDTFSVGQPTLIDQMILASINNRITYNYGYCDYNGNIHLQQQMYVGQVYTYNSSVDVASGTLTYTVEGTAVASDLTNSLARIRRVDGKKQPSVHLRYLTSGNVEEGFRDLVNMYAVDTSDNEDEAVTIPEFDSTPVLDLIMGKVVTGATKKGGLPVREGGLVQLSHAPLTKSMEEAYALGLVSQSDYATWKYNSDTLQRYSRTGGGGAWLDTMRNQKTNIEQQLVTPYIAYIDDIEVAGKYGTLFYKKKTGYETDNVFEYDYGNDVQNSDVLSFSMTYDGAVAMAASRASDNVEVSIDADGNNIGHSEATTQVANLGRNTFPTLSGFDENSFYSKQELSDIMLYPFEADLEIMGQIFPSNMLDIIYVVVKINGTEHPTLTGSYKVLEITDNINSSGFTTNLHLLRETNGIGSSIEDVEKYVTNPESGNARATQDNISNTSSSTGTSSINRNQ